MTRAFVTVVVPFRNGNGIAERIDACVARLGNPAGLGWGLVSAQEAMRASETFAYLFAIGVLDVCTNYALGFVVRRLLPGLAQAS